MRKLSIWKIKAFIVIMVIIQGALTLKAQDNNLIKDKITEIKLNEDFIFGEGVSDDKEMAYGLAMDDLLIFANELKSRNSQEKLSASDLLTKVETLVYENGSRYEVIVYIPLQIVLDTERKESSAKSGIMITKPGFVTTDDEPEEEEVDIMTVDNQTKEEFSQPEETVPSLTPKIEEPVQEVTIEEETNLEKKTQTEETELLTVQEEPNIEILKSNISNDYKGEIEDFLVTQDNFAEIKTYLSDMKRSGKIVETGATDKTTNLPQDATLILIDELGGILAVLSPINKQERMNYKTLKSDSENNYNSKFIVWYKK